MPLLTLALLAVGAGLSATAYPAEFGCGTSRGTASAGQAVPVGVLAAFRPDRSRGTANTQPDRSVAVRDLEGKTWTGQLVKLDARQLTLRAKETTTIPIDDILRIDFPKSQRISSERKPVVYLANGDQIVANVQNVIGDKLHVNVSQQAAFKLPLSSIRAILLRQPNTHASTAKLQAQLLAHTARKDLIILRNGDRILGRLKSLDKTSILMSGTAGRVPRKNVAAIAFDQQYVEAPKMPPRRWVIDYQDGSRLTARSVNYHGTFNAELLDGTKYKVIGELVLSLQRFSPAVKPLSAISPKSYKYTPFLAGDRKLQTNLNVLGGPMSLRGMEYAVGLGMHSRSRVTYAVPAGTRHFLATIGIDDAARGRGSAIFAVEVDGKRVFTSKPLSGSDKPLPVGPISLAGAKTLTLVVDYGPGGDILDYADWCDAVIVSR